MFLRQQRPEVDLSNELLSHLLMFEMAISQLRRVPSAEDGEENASSQDLAVDPMQDVLEHTSSNKLVQEYEDDEGPMRLAKELEEKSWMTAIA